MRILDDAPTFLAGEGIFLRYGKTVPGDESQGLVPCYHFKIVTLAETVVGHINFRVGDTPHVRFAAGHIGYEVEPEHRGHGYALAACKAISPFVRRHYEQVLLTVDPSNGPSIRIIEQLGAKFLDEVEVPANDPAYIRGARRKKRYCWTL
jgi:tagatose 1,6-diphosphate aldolase